MAESINDLLQKLPPTQESIDSIKLTVVLIKDDRDSSENEERKSVLKKNIDQCNNRIKQIQQSIKK